MCNSFATCLLQVAALCNQGATGFLTLATYLQHVCCQLRNIFNLFFWTWMLQFICDIFAAFCNIFATYLALAPPFATCLLHFAASCKLLFATFLLPFATYLQPFCCHFATYLQPDCCHLQPICVLFAAYLLPLNATYLRPILQPMCNLFAAMCHLKLMCNHLEHERCGRENRPNSSRNNPPDAT